MLNDVPMKRYGKAEEIGELVLFMCSDACTFMTADTVYVNGQAVWRNGRATGARPGRMLRRTP